MPDAVETAGDGDDGGEEGVAHPDAEDGVLLAEGLAGGDRAAVAAADAAAQPELEDAGEQRGGEDLPDHGAGAALHDGAGAHQDGERQRDGPDIEGQVREAE